MAQYLFVKLPDDQPLVCAAYDVQHENLCVTWRKSGEVRFYDGFRYQNFLTLARHFSLPTGTALRLFDMVKGIEVDQALLPGTLEEARALYHQLNFSTLNATRAPRALFG